MISLLVPVLGGWGKRFWQVEQQPIGL